MGKLPSVVLERYVLGRLGARSPQVALGPRVGVDFAAIRVGRGYLIVSSDPVTGAGRHVGWIAVNVAANDVATSGWPPQYLEVVLLLPEGADVSLLSSVASEIHRAAKSLGLSIVGGHTEVSPGLERPVVCVTCFGYAQHYVSADMARPADKIILTKTAGLEGTLILGGGRPLRLLRELSVVAEAVDAYRAGGVHAMHDCTEGGVLGALYEMSKSSGLGFNLYEDRVPLDPATKKLCAKRGLDPLRLISSGSLIIAAHPSKAHQLVRQLRARGHRATLVGEFTSGPRLLIHVGGNHEEIASEPVDELWRALSKNP